MTNESSPCQMGAADPAYMGFLPRDETIAALNELLEAERAGAAAVQLMRDELAEGERELAGALELIGRDEGRFCRMLLSQIRRLDGDPSGRTGAFLEKLAALDGFSARMRLLIRGQAWVERRLGDILPRIADDELARELGIMRAVHDENVRACEVLLETYASGA